MSKKLTPVIISACLTLLLNACSSLEPKQAYQAYQPSTLPVRNITHFDAALTCFDEVLVKAAIKKPIYITSEGIPNHAGADITMTSGLDMFIATVTQLQGSNAFKFIDLPSLPSTQLLEQLGLYKSHPALFEEYAKILNRWNKDNPTPKMLTYPDYRIRGAITQSEKAILVDGMGGSVTMENGDFGISRDDMVSIIAMDMNVVDNANFEVLNGINSSNAIAVYKQGLAGDLGGRIKKAGVYFNFSFDKSQGTGQAIRTLMQLNTIELLGKLAGVPYQQCLPNGLESPEEYNRRLGKLQPAQVLASPIASTKINKGVGLTLSPSKSIYRLNDVLTFKTEVSDDAHVHCFYQNYQGHIWRIFPNQVQASDFIKAHAPVSIPEQNRAFEIALDLANVTEQLMCVAAKEQLTSDFVMGGAVSEQSMLPVDDLEAVIESYRATTPGTVSEKRQPIRVQ